MSSQTRTATRKIVIRAIALEDSDTIGPRQPLLDHARDVLL
jgi:hypothetical protein